MYIIFIYPKKIRTKGIKEDMKNVKRYVMCLDETT